MNPAAAALIAELEAESRATRRVLESVPADRLTWRPHPKSMTLGQLAQHVASIPGAIAGLAARDGFDASQASFEPEPATSCEALLATHAEAVQKMRDYLGGLSEEQATAPWRLSFGDREVFTQPRLAVLRSLAYNHLYHHRGQLAVYLRLLDVPVPAVYGRSADDNPFARAAKPVAVQA